jgi:hypothetical protein
MALALLPVAAVTTSLALAATGSQKATLRAGADHARVGTRLHLSGSVPGAANLPVKLSFNPAGSKRSWREVGHTRTHAHGGFGFGVVARETGAFRAVPRGARPSDHTPLRVRSRTHGSTPRRGVIGHGVPIKGRVAPGDAGRRVAVSVSGTTLHTRARRGGGFRVTWRPHRTGTFPVHVAAHGDLVAAGSRDYAGRVTVFRPAEASWYGPGFYGQRTACGQTLQSSTLGVANKTLPCGTRVTLRYGSHQVTVPVIDRGPYSGNREYDLTQATKERLGFGSTGTVLTNR